MIYRGVRRGVPAFFHLIYCARVMPPNAPLWSLHKFVFKKLSQMTKEGVKNSCKNVKDFWRKMLDKGRVLWYNKKAVRRADGESFLKKVKKTFKNLLTMP